MYDITGQLSAIQDVLNGDLVGLVQQVTILILWVSECTVLSTIRLQLCCAGFKCSIGGLLDQHGSTLYTSWLCFTQKLIYPIR